jgi:hypothetical protein
MQRIPVDPQLTRSKAEAQGWRCHWCDCEMIDSRDLPANGSPAMERLARALGIVPFSSRWQGQVRYRVATGDHLLPTSQGGTENPENIVAACAFCNSWRGDRPANITCSDIEQLIREGGHPCTPQSPHALRALK